MAKSAGVALTALVARRKKDNKLVLLGRSKVGDQIVELQELDESSDRALDLYDRLRESKGVGGKYSAATLFLRAKAQRQLQFE